MSLSMSINSLQELGSDIQSATKRIEEYNKTKSNMDENYVNLKKKTKANYRYTMESLL